MKITLASLPHDADGVIRYVSPVIMIANKGLRKNNGFLLYNVNRKPNWHKDKKIDGYPVSCKGWPYPIEVVRDET